MALRLYAHGQRDFLFFAAETHCPPPMTQFNHAVWNTCESTQLTTPRQTPIDENYSFSSVRISSAAEFVKWTERGNLFYSAKAGRFDPVTYFSFMLSFCYKLWTWTRGREQSYMCPNIIFGDFLLFWCHVLLRFRWPLNYKKEKILKEIIELCEMWFLHTCGTHLNNIIKLELMV